jgi:BirA family transcriptional regulator, biotin operon repressor / biotin---[acetyl-CoA-carboxylase] ligase
VSGTSAPFGAPRHHRRSCGSTNDVGRVLAADGAPHGTVVTAEEQTAGRGRQGRSWIAPAGKALLYSAVVRPLDKRHMLLPLAAALAVSEAAERAGGVRCKIKWPNDVWIEGRKCAGVLIEARPQDGWGVIGVGLNVSIEPDEFPPELRETATSLGGEATVGTALAALNEAMEHWATAEPQAVLGSFRERDALRGSVVSWDGGGGTAAGIDERGNLVVRQAGGEAVSLGAGEVHLG